MFIFLVLLRVEHFFSINKYKTFEFFVPLFYIYTINFRAKGETTATLSVFVSMAVVMTGCQSTTLICLSSIFIGGFGLRCDDMFFDKPYRCVLFVLIYTL